MLTLVSTGLIRGTEMKDYFDCFSLGGQAGSHFQSSTFPQPPTGLIASVIVTWVTVAVASTVTITITVTI